MSDVDSDMDVDADEDSAEEAPPAVDPLRPDELEMYEQLTERFFANARKCAPEALTKHAAPISSLLTDIKRGMLKATSKQTSLHSYFSSQ